MPALSYRLVVVVDDADQGSEDPPLGAAVGLIRIGVLAGQIRLLCVPCLSALVRAVGSDGSTCRARSG